MDNSKFIIFLDVDGVICSYSKNIYTANTDHQYADDGEHYFLPEAIQALNAIITFYDADLCMISSWNSKFRDEVHYKEFLESRGIIVNTLYIGNQHNRAEFILSAIKEHNLKFYLIIDDEAHQYYQNMKELQYKRILKPDRNRCLDMYDFAHVTNNFKLNS